MLIAIWDFFFTRRQWTIIKEISVYETSASSRPYKFVYVLQDQFGNVKRKKV